MLCCVGLIGGSVVGQALGGPWIYIGPAAGFGLGLVGDMKMMGGLRKRAGEQQDGAGLQTKAEGPQGAQATESGPSCGIAAGLTRLLGGKGEKEKGEMTLAENRKTYETDAVGPPPRG